MSKYKKVYDDLKNKINDKIYKAGNYLPSESELAKMYNYSKDTVRKALSMLELDGYIQKIKGKNSIVLENNYNNIILSNIRTHSELNKSEHLDIKTNLISLYIVQGISKLMDIFQVNEKVDFYKVVRTRSHDEEVVEYDVIYFDRRVIKYMTPDIPEKSTYEYIEKELGLNISHSRKKIKFRYANEDEKKYMNLENYDMIVEIESFTYLSNGALFQYGTTSYRPDKFTFSIVAKR